MAISTAAAVIGGGALVGGLFGGSGASKAAKAQAAAAGQSAQVQWNMFQEQKEMMAPWLEVGEKGLNKLSALLLDGDMSQFQQSPGYQFAMEQGTQAVTGSQAAGGMLQSGNTMKELTQFGQGLANQEFNNYINQLSGVAGTGQAAASTLGGFGSQTAANMGNAYMAQGQAQAAGAMAWPSAFNSTMGNLTSLSAYKGWV